MIFKPEPLLDTLAEGVDRLVPELPLMLPQKRNQMLYRWNATQADYPKDLCVHELFERQAAKTPDATALAFANQTLSYGELNARANRLAQHLRTLGAGPDRLVAICVERSFGMVEALLASLKAGAAYVPLDPAYPQDRLAFMLEDSAPAALIAHGPTRKAMAGLGAHCPLIDLDADAAQWEGLSAANLPREETGLKPEHLAYVIYTSGSTGRPKGVMIEQCQLSNSSLARLDYYQSTGATRLLLLPSFAFDAFGAGAYLSLLAGGSLYLPQNPGDIEKLASLISLHQITHLIGTPSLYQALLKQMDKPVASLICVVLGGEVSSSTLLQEHFGKAAQAGLFNEYGPTEATIWSTVCQYQTPDQAANVIGKPIANTRIYLLNEHLQAQPPGIPGELCIAGQGLARGYLNQAELTAEKFQDVEVFGKRERIYKTGDLAAWLPDGNLQYLGRLDHQVKLRGFRIELGEIEALLSQHPAVDEAVVVVYEADGNPRLLVYMTVAQAQDVETGEALIAQVRRWLKTRLPDYMMPAHFIVLDKLPLTPNGKIDRKALPIPDASLAEVYQAPRNPTEQTLAAIWATLFKRQDIGIHDNFFNLGGNSILIIQMLAHAQREGLNFKLHDVFERPTIVELASVRAEAQAGDIRPTPRTDDASDIPLSFGQYRLWLKQMTNPGGGNFNLSDGFRLTGKLDRAALQQSLDTMIRRHEILRTVFPVKAGMPVQLVMPAAPVAMAVKDLQAWPENTQMDELKALAMAETSRQFDLAQGPLLSVTLVQLAEDSHVLLLCLHHILSDFLSREILLDELLGIYSALVSGQAPNLPALPIQYADYALWQRLMLTPQAWAAKLDYWRSWFAQGEPPVLILPTDRPRLSPNALEAGMLRFQLPAELANALKALSQRVGVTVYSVFLSGLSALLHGYSACEDIVIASPVANRNHAALQPLIGLIGTMLLLRIDLAGNPKLAELLAEVQRRVLVAMAHQDPPFEEAIKILQPERQRDTPLSRVVLNLLPGPPQKQMRLPGLTLESLALGKSDMNLDLALAFWEEETGLHGWWRYRKDIFDAETVVRINQDFQTVLESMAANPEQSLERLVLNLKG